ncbi:hypothetical protein Tco_0054129 [Tanacetum coccineum]
MPYQHHLSPWHHPNYLRFPTTTTVSPPSQTVERNTGRVLFTNLEKRLCISHRPSTRSKIARWLLLLEDATGRYEIMSACHGNQRLDETKIGLEIPTLYLRREEQTFFPHEVWGRSMDASDTTRSEVRALRSTILAQQTEIVALRATDRPRQAQLVETLILMSTLTVGHDVAYAMTWTDLKKKMTDKYCPRGEIKKLEAEMFPEELDKIERYVCGFPDMIHGSVVASRPKIMQEAIEIATELMDKKIRTFAE